MGRSPRGLCSWRVVLQRHPGGQMGGRCRSPLCALLSHAASCQLMSCCVGLPLDHTRPLLAHVEAVVPAEQEGLVPTFSSGATCLTRLQVHEDAGVCRCQPI